MESLAAAGLATMKRFKTLQEVELESVENQSNVWPKHLFLAQFDRFQLWAVNLGIFVTGHGSLDYRIRDSESMKEAILKMIKNLNRSIDEVLAHLHGNNEQEDEDSDTDTNSEMESEIDLLLDSIKDPIDRLYKMAVWIRNPANRITSTKARNLQQVDEETNVDLFKSFERVDYDYVSSLFLQYEKNKALQENPTAQYHDAVGDDEAFVEDQVWEPIRKTLKLNRIKISNGGESYLVRRIARANGLRRQQFAYWRKHKNKLREHATLAVEAPTHNSPTTSHIIQLEGKNEKLKAPLSVTTATQLCLSYETGKELEKENAMTLAVSEYAPSSWNPSKDIFSFPLPPKTSKSDAFFECPYCYTICPASMLSEKAWRAHIIRDLRPYICTFENCLDSEQLYDSRDDWIYHETSMHQNVFRCPKNEEETFTTLATYEEHTQMYHKEDAMPPSFAKSTTTNIHRSCPICSIVLGTVQKLQSHIALHLDRFAMFALPRCTDDSNEGGSGGRSASVRLDSNRSLNEDPDIESNATSGDEDSNTANYAIIEKIRAMSREIAMLRSSVREGSGKEDQYLLEGIAKIRGPLKSYGEIIRAWNQNDTVNAVLFEFGEVCIGVGLIDEAIETLEHLKSLQISQLEHDDPALLRTNQRLVTAYQINGTLQEVNTQSGHDTDLHREPRKGKALDIFASTGAGKSHPETILGPGIWETRQIKAQPYAEAQQSFRDLVQQKHQQQQQIISEESNCDTSHVGQDLETPGDILRTDGSRFIQMIEQHADKRMRSISHASWSESAGEEGELKSDSSDEKVKDWILKANIFQHHKPQNTTSITQDTFENRHDGLDFGEGIDLAGHGGRGPGRADRNLQVPTFIWTPAYEATFFRSLIESVQLGFRQNATFKAGAWERASQALQEHHGVSPDKSLLIEKSNNSRERFRLWRGLRENPDFIYDPVSRTVRTTEEGWRAHIEREPLSRALRGETFTHEEYMEVLYPELVNSPLRDDSTMPGTDVLNLPDAQMPVEVTKLQAEEAFQMKEQGVPSNAPEYIKASQFLLNFQQQRNTRQNQQQTQQTQQIAQDSQDARDNLVAVNAIAEQETMDNPRRPMEEDYEMREQRHDIESEILVLKEMFRVLVEESQAGFEQAAEVTQLQLEAQTLAQETTLYMSDVEELKSQFFGATNILERNEKGNALVHKIRSFDFLGMRDMIKEIQNKREAREAQQRQTPRERTETQAQSEERLILQMQEAGKELTDHEEKNIRSIKTHGKALEAMDAKRGQKDSSAKRTRLEARDASTEVPTRLETPKPESNLYEEEISAEDEKIGDVSEKLTAPEEELRLVQAEKEVQVPSGSENQKTKSRGVLIKTWQCCQCGMSGMLNTMQYRCTEHYCQHLRCKNCTVFEDQVGLV